MGLFGNPESGQAEEEGEDGFLVKSKPLVATLGEDLENGLVELLEGLVMGLRGEGEEGEESAKPKCVLTLRTML